MKHPSKLSLFVLVVALLATAVVAHGRAVLPATAAPQSTFIVNSPADNISGACDAIHCTLREAILAANNEAGPSTITFAPTLTSITLASSLPTIVEPLTITGPGINALTINGALVQSTSMIRVGTGGSLTISGLTMAEAGANSKNINAGGAILSTPPITMSDMRFNNNHALFGGALAVYADTTLSNVWFNNNQADEDGGAIVAYNGTVTITEAEFHGNSAGARGGAIYGQPNFLNVSDSVFAANDTQGNGGAIAAHSTVSIQRNLFNNNTATGDGGGIYVQLGNSFNYFINLVMYDDYAGGVGNALAIVGNNPPVVNHVAYNTIAASSLVEGSAVAMNATATMEANNNIITYQEVGLLRMEGTLTENYNLFYGNTNNTQGLTAGVNSFTADPRFVSLSEPILTLLPTSPAIDAAGGALLSVGTDFNSNSRPQGSRNDIGAYELTQVAVAPEGGAYALANTGAAITVTQTGDLAAVRAVWIPLPHPDSTYGDNGYWAIEGVNDNGEIATGFSLTIQLPHNNHPNPTICRWDGATWDCGRDGFNSTHVWRHNVTGFSDWAVGAVQEPPEVVYTIYLPLVVR